MAEFTSSPLTCSHFAFKSTAREMVEKERAIALIDEIADSLKDCTSACISNKSFSEDAASIIGVKLAEYEATLTHVDFSDIIAGRMEVEALVALKNLCDPLKNGKFIDLDLSDNALGRPGIEACRAILSHKTLQCLKVSNCGLSAEAAQLLAEILSASCAPPLSTFHFYNNMGGDGAAVAISIIVSMCPALNDFRFSATRAMKPGCKAIAESLLKMSNLQKLDVSDCCFGVEGAQILANAIKANTDIVSLNVRDSNLEEDGSKAILFAIKDGNLNLEFLDMSGNEVNTDVLEECSNAIKSLQSIQELYLDDNEITSDGATTLANLLKKSRTLKTLSLCTCEITAAGAYRIAKAVSTIPTFATLRLDGNEICERGVIKIQEILEAKGMTLDTMEENDDEGDDDLDDALDEDDEDSNGRDEEEEDKDVDDLAASMKNTGI